MLECHCTPNIIHTTGHTTGYLNKFHANDQLTNQRINESIESIESIETTERHCFHCYDHENAEGKIKSVLYLK